MSLPTWTPAALSSELRPYQRAVWRIVEAQHRVSTMKLVDSLGEQDVLENLIEETKPAYPAECGGLHYLFKTPFRYGAAYPSGSRFRRAGLTPGVYYASEEPRAAVAEMAFYRLLFFAESPQTPWPTNPSEYTGFSAALKTRRMLDLTAPPLERDAALWRRLTDCGPCQALGGCRTNGRSRNHPIWLRPRRGWRGKRRGAVVRGVRGCRTARSPDVADRRGRKRRLRHS